MKNGMKVLLTLVLLLTLALGACNNFFHFPILYLSI
jgi:hypothetical protein